MLKAMKFFPLSFSLFCLLCLSSTSNSSDLRLQVITVATEETDGFKRFISSAKHYDINVEVIGMGKEWKGGDIQRYPGGGYKLNLLKSAIAHWKENEDVLLMFVDSYDVIFAANADAIIQKFLDFNTRSVFSAEQFCWPDKSLASSYPKIGLGKRFLCSGGYIGYAPVIYSLINDHEISDTDDDQLYYTKLFLDEEKKTKYGMRLDTRSHIFQNLNGAEDEVELEYADNDTFARNAMYNTRAAVYHGNGGSKLFLNYLGNYIPNQWTKSSGCINCADTSSSLPEDKTKWPKILMGLFVENPTPFFNHVLERLEKLTYPKNLINLWIHNRTPYHDSQLAEWVERVGKEYKSVKLINSEEAILPAADAQTTAMKTCVSSEDCDYYFYVESTAVLDDPYTLKRLILLNRNVIAPLLVRPGKLWSNFWGAISPNGFYGRSRDYNNIVNREYIGVWNVPYISTAILFKGDWLSNRTLNNLPQYHSDVFDQDMAFCDWMRNNGHFMFVSNMHEYGHLLSTENYETHHLHNDLFNIFENRLDWEKRYIHANHSRSIDPDVEISQPCTDVYWFPVVSDTYTKEMVEELENYGAWSNGENEDPRLDGGYENVPTRDIHMNQIGFEKQWLDILRTYIVPIQTKVFPGYYSKGTAYMNFVVKYHPQGQPNLRPHHDSSTFTINIALSTPGIDYEGGGCRFIRQQCSVVDTKLGWALMHPGRLTHYHEGLQTTKGTRYIMVSFVDP